MTTTKRRFSRTGLLTFAAAFAAAGPTFAVEWDMPTPYPDKTFHTQNISQFASDIERATGGELKIKLHSAGSLFKHADIKNAVRGGQVPIGEFFLSRLSNEDATYGMDSQPFLADTYDDAARLWGAQKPAVEELLDREGLLPLFSVPWPPQGLYTKNAITGVADLKGVKFRAYNATLEQFAKKTGAAPTQVEVPDIPQAFATGRVEAMITSPSTGANSQSWDFVKHYYDIQAWLPKNIVVVNKRAFRALEPKVQAAVLSAAAEAETRGWAMSRRETVDKTQVLRDNGMAVHEPSDALKAEFRAIGREMLDDWQEHASPEAKRVYAAYTAQ